MQFRQLMGEHREAILYVVCGAFTTLVSLGSYALFEFVGIVPDLSNILSWICGVCFAFVVKGGLRSQKTLSLLMKAMEGEGMYLKFSDVLKKPDVAYALGKRLNVERNL